ncbi:hypothetical protein [Capnocytophaga ochracea]
MIEVLEIGEPKAEVKNYKERLSRCGYDLPWDEKSLIYKASMSNSLLMYKTITRVLNGIKIVN